MIALLMSPLGKIAGYAAAAAAIVAAFFIWLGSHDAGVRADEQAKYQAAIAVKTAALQVQKDAAVQEAITAERSRSAQNVQIKEVIRRVPVTTTCAQSPAVGSALDQLWPAPTSGGPNHSATNPAGVSGRAGTPAPVPK